MPPAPVKVFYSYAHLNEDLRDELHAHLAVPRARGLIEEWYDRQIPPGGAWDPEIKRRLEEAEIILLLITKDFLNSRYCREFEMARALEREREGTAQVIPIFLQECFWDEDDFEHLQGLPPDAKPVDSPHWRSREVAFKLVVKGIVEVAKKVQASRLSAPLAGKPAPVLITMGAPPPTPAFTGRRDELKAVQAALKKKRRAAIYGMGGVGKTQLSRKYVEKHAAEYPDGVYWLLAENEAVLSDDVATVAGQLGLVQEGAGGEVAADAFRAWMRVTPGALVVFDNVPDVKTVRPYLQVPSGAHVLLTTRYPTWRPLAEPVGVTTWSPEVGADFLIERTDRPDTEREAAERLSEKLGGLPLALEQAAAFIDKRNQTFEAYSKLFDTHRATLLERRSETADYPDSVATTWNVAFEWLETNAPAAAQLLQVCAFLAPDAIPMWLIRQHAEVWPEALREAVGDDMVWDSAVEAVLESSLVGVEADTLGVHRLVQAVTRDRMDDSVRDDILKATLDAVNKSFPGDEIRTSVASWTTCAELLPHALTVADLHIESSTSGALVRLLNQVGLYIYTVRADYPAARSAFERALVTSEQVYGPDHPQMAISLHNLGSVLRAEGDLAAARAACVRALNIDERTYGPEHPEVANDASNLGLILHDEGNLAGARAAHERALAISEREYGPNHHTVATAANNLGAVLQDEGDLAGARAAYERALAIDEKIYGPEHPEVAIDLGNLGVLLKEEGDIEGAQAAFERALAVFERTFGADHPHTRGVRANLKSLDGEADVPGS